MAESRFTWWRKSSRSSGGDNCVEVATTSTTVGVRDSKNPQDGVLEFDRAAWHTFIAAVRDGDFER